MEPERAAGLPAPATASAPNTPSANEEESVLARHHMEPERAVGPPVPPPLLLTLCERLRRPFCHVPGILCSPPECNDSEEEKNADAGTTPVEDSVGVRLLSRSVSSKEEPMTFESPHKSETPRTVFEVEIESIMAESNGTPWLSGFPKPISPGMVDPSLPKSW
jgi:hypothetical protein